MSEATLVAIATLQTLTPAATQLGLSSRSAKHSAVHTVGGQRGEWLSECSPVERSRLRAAWRRAGALTLYRELPYASDGDISEAADGK